MCYRHYLPPFLLPVGADADLILFMCSSSNNHGVSCRYSAIRDQSKVIRILKIPNFLNEEQMLVKDVHPFKQIRVHDIKFRCYHTLSAVIASFVSVCLGS